MSATRGEPRATTVSGIPERGDAIQRHLVRDLEALDGVTVIMSFSLGEVDISVDEMAAFTPLRELCDEYGYRATVGTNGNYEADGSADIDLERIEVSD